MSSAQADPFLLPPIDKHNLISIWMETLLYGMNIILFALCLYVLLHKKSKSSGQWPLLVTSMLLFSLASIHVGLGLRQLLECFVYGVRGGIPGSTILYWLNFFSTVEKLKGYVYTFIDTIQDLVLIWRLYVVWSNSWKIALLPLLLEVTHFILAIYETYSSQRDNGIPFSSSLPLVAYILVIIVNVGTTGGIIVRLWVMGRRHADSFVTSWSSSVPTSSNRYLAPIFTLIESGAIFTFSSIVLLALFVRSDPQLGAAVNVAVQLACLTPLLIIVRVGFGITHSIGKRKETFTSQNSTRPTVEFNSIRVDKAYEIDASRTQIGSYTENGVYALDNMRNKPSGSLAEHQV